MTQSRDIITANKCWNPRKPGVRRENPTTWTTKTKEQITRGLLTNHKLTRCEEANFTSSALLFILSFLSLLIAWNMSPLWIGNPSPIQLWNADTTGCPFGSLSTLEESASLRSSGKWYSTSRWGRVRDGWGGGGGGVGVDGGKSPDSDEAPRVRMINRKQISAFLL